MVVSPNSTSVTYVPEDPVIVRVTYRESCLSSISLSGSASRGFGADNSSDRNSKTGSLCEVFLGSVEVDVLVGDTDPSPGLRVKVSTSVSVLSLILFLIPKRGFGDIWGQQSTLSRGAA